MRFWNVTLALLVAGGVAACDDSLGLARATTQNTVDTVILYSLHHSAPSSASAYLTTPQGAGATTDLGAFDFAYDDVDSLGGPAFYSPEVLKIYAKNATNPGLKPVTGVLFDSLARADLNGYTTDSIMPIDSGDVFLSRASIRCSIGVPLYSKLQVAAIDTAAHTVTLYVVSDINCGYRGLLPGLPKH